MEAVSDARALVEHFSFPSASGTVRIHAVLWMPAAAERPAPRGIVQLVHGMAEYVERYDEFARFLVGEGYIVCGSDHIGHGKSVNDASEWGDLPARDGARILVEDVHALRTLMEERFGTDVPYVLFGHSMGSFVVRAYAARHAAGLAGIVACGTADQPSLKSKGGNALARFFAATRGNAHRSSVMHGLADGAYSKQIRDPRTPCDWLSYDCDHVDRYMADEACGFMFSVGGYAALTQLTAWNADKKETTLIPDELPLLLVAGADDPVGDFGKGVTAVFERLRSAGKNVEMKLYAGRRHEIVTGIGHGEVWTDIAEWLARIA